MSQISVIFLKFQPFRKCRPFKNWKMSFLSTIVSRTTGKWVYAVKFTHSLNLRDTDTKQKNTSFESFLSTFRIKKMFTDFGLGFKYFEALFFEAQQLVQF